MMDGRAGLKRTQSAGLASAIQGWTSVVDNIDYVKHASVIFRGLPSLQRLRPITSAWSHRQHAPVGKALKKVRFGSVRTAYDAIHACNAGPSFPHACPAALVHAARSCKPQEVQAGRSAMSSKH